MDSLGTIAWSSPDMLVLSVLLAALGLWAVGAVVGYLIGRRYQ